MNRVQAVSLRSFFCSTAGPAPMLMARKDSEAGRGAVPGASSLGLD